VRSSVPVLESPARRRRRKSSPLGARPTWEGHSRRHHRAIIDQLRAGTVRWQRPWRIAQNIVSRKAYRGINSLTLGLSNLGSRFWMTFRQAIELGGHVRKGEKSRPVIDYKLLEKRDDAGNIIMTAKGRSAFKPFIR
jgi:antirestriction protein ArdC